MCEAQDEMDRAERMKGFGLAGLGGPRVLTKEEGKWDGDRRETRSNLKVAEVVVGQRASLYGKPEKSFEQIAKSWMKSRHY